MRDGSILSPTLKIKNVTDQPVSISILTATYNAEQHLPRLIQSLRDQSDPDFQWVVIDGGSTDGTLSQLQDAGDILGYLRSEPDFGIYHALNKAVAVASGAYYLVAGADDRFDPRAVENFRKQARATGADIISAPVSMNGRLVQPSRRVSWFRSSPPLVAAHSLGSLIRTDLHHELGFYSRHFPIAADTLFLLKAWKAGKNFAYIPDSAGVFGNEGLSSLDLLGSLSESMRVHAQVRGAWSLQFALFILRVLKNSRRIAR